ncbi:aminopeptidase P family protein [Candidatus Mycoplasma mahonii]|uniref:aminopeptidase P family protein n=1 Tax=Candidatus Mycoplasma mahonii TaxID=3004105 RepID=UPI0026EB83F3|nr:Xaa-Pro peptidase family protein [Candidatus Mycoplasma mahonii]WKX02213.1 Xaa-Pro peptidase family protein [Candidatus Mycoplasma mahonii]
MNRTKLDAVMKSENLDVVFSTSPQMRIWYAGIHSSAGYLFIEPTESELYIDGRYIEYAQANAKNVKVSLLSKPSIDTFVASKLYKRIGVEKEYFTLSEVAALKKWWPNAKIVEISGPGLRIIKDEAEIKLMKKAGSIALHALKELEADIKPGISELELDRKLEFLLRKHGAKKGSFDAIVVSGKRGSLPHGNPSAKILQTGELLTIDFGALYEGYCSDITRTFHVGNVTDPKILEFEEVLRTAQQMGKDAVKPGVTTGAIDKVCRDYITKKGFGEYFVHSTGHGLGIDVHELPNVTSNKALDVVLEAGMVITVEPGIYIPGVGGIRVEDDILVTKNGYEVLSKIN